MIERRFITGPAAHKSLTTTRTGTGVTISGYATMFGRPSQLLAGSFKETIEPGAFRDVLASGADVAGLFNHDPSLILGRTSAGTMRLFEDRLGLRYEIDAADDHVANLVAVHIARGDIRGSSFSFKVAPGGDTWSGAGSDTAMRTIRRVAKLVDLGPVTFPAYPDATAEVDDDDERGMLRRRLENEEFELERELAEASLARQREASILRRRLDLLDDGPLARYSVPDLLRRRLDLLEVTP